MTTGEAIRKLKANKINQDPFKRKMDAYLQNYLPECCIGEKSLHVEANGV
jgi:hypothetical protein